jgi:hypothetical protein
MLQSEDSLLKLLPTAEQALEKLIMAKAAEASAAARKREADEAAKRAAVESLQAQTGVSDAERLKNVASIIDRA